MGGRHLVMNAEMQLVATQEDHSTNPTLILSHHLMREHHHQQFEPA